jgi:hypothetical protein
MLNTPFKRGRPTAVYKTSWGEQIHGLMRLGDGRWRASGPDKFTFSESDERMAIAHFRHWQLQNSKANLGNLKVFTDAQDAMIDISK